MALAPPPDARDAFRAAAGAFVDAVAGIEPSQFPGPATSKWTVLELVAHTGRAFLATQTVLDATVDPSSRFLDGAAAYYRAAMSIPGVHEGISQRARAAAEVLGDDPVGELGAQSSRVVSLVEATPLDREVQHFAGRLRFGDYVVTRVVELVLHTVDLQLALGVVPAVPEVASRVVRDLVVQLSDRAEPLAVACALTGRPTPCGCDVLG